MDSLPSKIPSNENSGYSEYPTHETLGYRRASAQSFSLLRSPTPEDTLGDSPPSDILKNDVSIAAIGDTSLASITQVGDSPRKLNTSRVVERAVEYEQQAAQQQKLSPVPPQRVSHHYYPKHAKELGDPLLIYTQTFIWCLQRRIDRIERNPPKDLTTSQLLMLIRVLKIYQSQLISGMSVPQYRPHEPLRLKPRMENPENVRSAQIVADVESYRHDLLQHVRTASQFLKEAETKLLASSAPLPESTNKYDPVMEEVRRENTRSIKALCNEMAKIDQLNAIGKEKIMELSTSGRL